MKQSNPVAIGLRSKTGRAIVVVLGGAADSPIVLVKKEIKLVDPKVPGTAQPYHEVMDLPWEESQRAVHKYVRAIENVAAKELARLINQITKDGATVIGAGIVGAKDRDLARIGNNHIRAHAAEGVLFRAVLEFAAEKNSLSRRTFGDRDFVAITKAELGKKHASLARKIDDLRRSVAPPWRTDEKQAALAAWLVLHGK
jgi:hypothetical protein